MRLPLAGQKITTGQDIGRIHNDAKCGRSMIWLGCCQGMIRLPRCLDSGELLGVRMT